MANRRMFSKTITSSSRFLMMPSSTQNLYFQLGMNSDDDGFCEHFTVMRMVEAKPDDLKILQAKEFVQIFDERVLVILDWKENNYLRTDRYQPSKYLEIYKEEIKQISQNTKNIPLGIPMVDQMDTQVRLGKVNTGVSGLPPGYSIKEEGKKERKVTKEMQEVFDLFQDNPARFVWGTRVHERKAAAVLHSEFGINNLRNRYQVSQMYKEEPLCPQIYSPSDFLEKMPKMEKFLKDKKR